MGGKFSRKTTHTSDWTEAQRISEVYQKADSWTGKPRVDPAVPEPAPPKPRTAIPDAIQEYLSNREAANLAPASLLKYGVFTRKLQAFADKRGYVMLDQFTRADIDVFYSTSSLGIRSKGKMLETLRTCFRFCVNRELVAKSPVSPDLKPPIGANRVANKMPFTDKQLANIIKACDKVNADQKSGRWGNRFGSGEWTGEDLKDSIWLMTHTGLRIPTWCSSTSIAWTATKCF